MLDQVARLSRNRASRAAVRTTQASHPDRSAANPTLAHRGSLERRSFARCAIRRQAIALDRLRRILRSGGVLRLLDVVYSFDAADADERLEAWCARAGSDSDQDWSRAELEEHVRDENSTFNWLLEPMMQLLRRPDLREVRASEGLRGTTTTRRNATSGTVTPVPTRPFGAA
jgi:hypothetical protein